MVTNFISKRKPEIVTMNFSFLFWILIHLFCVWNFQKEGEKNKLMIITFVLFTNMELINFFRLNKSKIRDQFSTKKKKKKHSFDKIHPTSVYVRIIQVRTGMVTTVNDKNLTTTMTLSFQNEYKKNKTIQNEPDNFQSWIIIIIGNWEKRFHVLLRCLCCCCCCLVANFFSFLINFDGINKQKTTLVV